MSDLNLNVNATVSGGEDVDELATDLDSVEESVEAINQANPSVKVTTTGTEQAATDLGGVATKAGEIGTNAEGGATTLGEAMSGIVSSADGAKSPLDAVGQIAEGVGEKMNDAGGKTGVLGAALTGVGLLISAGIGLWERFSGRQSEATRTTNEVSDALNENVGALGLMKDALDKLIESGDFTGLDALNQALLGQDPEAFQRAAENLGVLGGTYEDVSGVIAGLQTDELATLNDLIAQSGIPPDLADSARELVLAGGELAVTEDRLGLGTENLGQNVNELNAHYRDQIDALVNVRAAQNELDAEAVAQQYLDQQRAVEGYAEMLERAKAAAGPDASTVDVFNEFVELQAQAAQTAEQFAQEQEDAAQGARDLASAMQSIDWQQAELEGATTAMSEFTRQQFFLNNQTQAQAEAFRKLRDSAEGVALTFDVTTEAGAAQQDALEGVAAVLDTQLAQAYDNANGSQAAFTASATTIANDTLARLKDELNLSGDQVTALADILGLLPEDIQTRYEMSGVAEAQLQLGLLQGAIEGLPPDLETKVNLLILQGDYVGARDTIVQFYNDNPVPAPVVAEPDTTAATQEFHDFAAEDRHATVVADADTETAHTDLLDEASEPRTALIVAVANNQAAHAALESLINEERKAPIDAYLRGYPSAAQIARAIGPVRVLVQGVWSTRIEGSRPR